MTVQPEPPPAKSQKPWPMSWVVIAILIYIACQLIYILRSD